MPTRLAILLAVVALGSAALYCFEPRRTHAIASSQVVHREGHSHVVAIDGVLPSPMIRRLADIAPDTNGRPRASRLKVFENGVPIGPAHSLHADIAAKGEGRYSHWGDSLVFSASDNSDPSSNGRRYSIGYAVAPPWWAVLVLVAGAGLALRTIANAATLAAVAFWTGFGALAIYANWVIAELIPAPLLRPDSGGYIFWSLLRTWGYPLLLHGYHAVLGSWHYLPIFQVNLLLAGLAVLAFALARRCGHGAAWLLVCLTFGAGTLMASAVELLTEPAFGAFAMAHLGFMILFLETGNRRHGGFAGACLAAAIAIKSVGVVLLGPVLVLVAFLAGLRRRLLLLVFLPAAATWLFPGAYNLLRHGEFETSHAGGLALGGHVAWAMHPRGGSPVEAEARIVEEAIQPATAKRPPSFASLLAYVDYTANEYNDLLWARMVPQLTRYYAQRRPPEPCTWDGLDRGGCVSTHVISINRTLLRLSREAIAAQPRAYLYHVAAHDYGLWRDVFGQPVDFMLAVNSSAGALPMSYDPLRHWYVSLLPPPPPFKPTQERSEWIAKARESPAKRLIDLATLRGGVEELLSALTRNPWILLGMALVASVAALRLGRLGATARACCYCALTLHAYMLGTALAQPSLVRYGMAVQGLAAALLVLFTWWMGSLISPVYHRLWPRKEHR